MTSQEPPSMAEAEAELPDALTDRAQWLCWREEQRNGMPTKPLVTPGTDGSATATDSDT